MSVIPCERNSRLSHLIEEYSEVLLSQAHTLGTHGLPEREFYDSGLFRGAIERVRGQFSAMMGQKREFVQLVLNYMQDEGFIQNWESAEAHNRHDYEVELPNQQTAVIEVKGCLDGNNTNIFERPQNASEFIIWSLCSNPGADPRKNAWSGIHTRLSAEVITRAQRVDGVIIWDWVCGTPGRPCPKLQGEQPQGRTTVGRYCLPPPCIYLMPSTIPHVRNNPSPQPHNIQDVGLLRAFHRCFGGRDEDLNRVFISVENLGASQVRTTRVERNGDTQQVSRPTEIRRA